MMAKMTKRKRKLTPEQKAAKAKRRREFETIFINRKQKSVRRAPTIDGMLVDEFIESVNDPLWLHQNEMWHLMDPPIDDEVSEPKSEQVVRQDDNLTF